jgi:alkaline phosphatase D
MPPRRLRALDRRQLLKAAISAGLVVPGLPLLGGSPARAQFKSDPFTLGVPSGEPAADGFVLWTRLAPEPLAGRGGMTVRPVEVTWEIGADPAMKQMVRSGTTTARVEVAHAVHVEVEGLDAAREYFYRFRAGDAESPVGCVRTLPLPGADVAALKFAAAGCQHWESGHYTAWRHIAEENLDFVFHYGDYIYEFARSQTAFGTQPAVRVMPEGFLTCINLLDYRRRYALYKTDPDLQAAHASYAFLPSFDDHEVSNNWAAEADRFAPPEDFLFRRAAAFQAWWEHMPVRRRSLPRGPDVLAYRHLHFGRLADVAVLDTRQYRSKQPCGDGIKANCTEAAEAGRTMLGAAQEKWLEDLLRSSQGAWQVLAQQVLFSPFDWRSFPWSRASDAGAGNMDAWDGARSARDRVLAMLREKPASNPVVLTGDVHRAIALEIKDDAREPGSRTLGVEFVSTSISSGGDGTARPVNEDALRTDNPHMKFIGEERGYTRHTVTPKTWTADYRAVERVTTQGAPVLTRKTFVVEVGKPGLE